MSTTHWNIIWIGVARNAKARVKASWVIFFKAAKIASKTAIFSTVPTCIERVVISIASAMDITAVTIVITAVVIVAVVTMTVTMAKRTRTRA